MSKPRYHTADAVLINSIRNWLSSTMARIANKTVDVNPR